MNIDPIPTSGAVYLVYLDGSLAYIGQAQSIRRRFASHSFPAAVKYGMWKGAVFKHLSVRFIECDCKLQRLSLESSLIESHQPRLNISGNTANKPIKVSLVSEPKNANFRRFVNETGSQAKVASLLGMSPGHVSLIFNGKRRVTVEMAERIEIASGGKFTRESLVFRSFRSKPEAA